MTKISQALETGDLEAVSQFVCDMFDIDLTDNALRQLVVQWAGRRPKTSWDTSCGPAIWIKNRMLNMRAFDVTHNPPTDFGDLTTAVLHTFFLSLEETDEMIAILHNEDVVTSEQRKKPARSKMFSTSLVTRPIDSTASSVTNKRHESLQ